MVHPSELLVVLPRPPAAGLGGSPAAAAAAAAGHSDPADSAVALSALERRLRLARWQSASGFGTPTAGGPHAEEVLGRALEEVSVCV